MNDYNKLYKIERQTLEAISNAICDKRGVPRHPIPEVTLMQQIKGLENLYQTVPDSMLSNEVKYSARSGSILINNEQIAALDIMGCVPALISSETSAKPVFAYKYEGQTYYYIGNYIT